MGTILQKREKQTEVKLREQIPLDWQNFLGENLLTLYWQIIEDFTSEVYQTSEIFPKKENIFEALRWCSPKEVKVVILGQDPYHGMGQANGLCFSVQRGIALPPSLQNIYKEMQTDVGLPPAKHGDLTAWAKQGILLLNTVLTVEKDKAASHKGMGWEWFTDTIIKSLSEKNEHLVFILWGNHARNKKMLIDKRKHHIIESAHPSPLSAYNGFFGSKPFSRTNEWLKSNGLEPIDWNVGE